MATLREELLNILLDLSEDQFKLFKFHLRDDGIPRANLEKADRLDTVELMINKYPDRGALELTLMILKKISRNDLVERLQNFRPKDFNPFHVGAHTEGSNRKKARPLMWVQQFAVEVTLDHDTAHPNLIVSDDGKQVHHGDFRKKLPNTPERFYSCVNVLGKQSFSSGRFYYEVQVKGKTAWTVGVAKESIKRRGNITLSPENGFWTMDLSDGDEYIAIDELVAHLSLKSNPERVGVFVDYEEGLISFYDVEAADHLYTFTGCSFTEKLYPFFSPCTNDKGRNSAPLIICPVKHNEEYERKKAELQSVQQFAVDVTLDTDTAHPNLILSDDGKQVHHGDVRKNLPDSPKRFDRCVNVLGKEGFSSERFYFEVQVKGKRAWTVGVAKESIDRKGKITLSPKYGFWTVWLRNGDEYTANDAPSVNLSLKMHPQKVAVFVDYKERLVSFYDAEAADLLYAFTDCSFTKKLYPFFSPCTNDNGINSAPLIICPVNETLNHKTHDLGILKEEYERKKGLEIINKYPDHGALKVTSKVLKKISRNDLVERSQNFRQKETKEPTTTTHPMALTPGNFGEEQSLDPPELAFTAGTVFKGPGPDSKTQSVSAEKKLKSVRREFIKRVSEPVLQDLLDNLLECEVVTDNERETALAKTTTIDKARNVIDIVRKKGSKASSLLINALCEIDPCLSSELKLT